jgi:hypothetical protein
LFKCAGLVDKIYTRIERIKKQINHPWEARSLKMDSEDCIRIWRSNSEIFIICLHHTLKDHTLKCSDSGESDFVKSGPKEIGAH